MIISTPELHYHLSFMGGNDNQNQIPVFVSQPMLGVFQNLLQYLDNDLVGVGSYQSKGSQFYYKRFPNPPINPAISNIILFRLSEHVRLRFSLSPSFTATT